MAVHRFGFLDFLVRLLMALVLVFASYNPTDYSWFYWVTHSADRLDPLLVFSGVVLLIGWVIYLRATARSLGVIGIILALAFVGSLIWLLVDSGALSLSNPTILQYVVLFVLSLLLATGMSWSHIRRKMTGQLDVDDVDEA